MTGSDRRIAVVIGNDELRQLPHGSAGWRIQPGIEVANGPDSHTGLEDEIVAQLDRRLVRSRLNQDSFRCQRRNLLVFGDLRYRNQREERMTTFSLMGAAAVVLSVLTAPAMARHMISGPVQSVYCATREAGNPHSKYCDYIQWSKWRQRGGWDASLDNACYYNPAYIPGECGRDAHGNVLFPPTGDR